MKTFYSFLALIGLSTAFAQVGINTTSPQATLHIAGANSTLRIDGLKAGNNSKNNGITDANLYVNKFGDLVLKADSPAFTVNMIGSGLFGSTTTLSTTGAQVTQTIANGTFTMTGDNWATISYDLGVSALQKNDGNRIDDGAPRLIKANYYIDNVLVSSSSMFFTHESTTSNSVNGILVLTGSSFKKLAAGSHTYKIEAVLNGGATGVKAGYGGYPAIDRFQIMEYN